MVGSNCRCISNFLKTFTPFLKWLVAVGEFQLCTFSHTACHWSLQLRALVGSKWYLIRFLVCISLMKSDVENLFCMLFFLFMCFLWWSFFWPFYVGILAIIYGLLEFYTYSGHRTCITNMIWKYFMESVAQSFNGIAVKKQKFWILMMSNFRIFSCMLMVLVLYLKNNYLTQSHKDFLPCRNFKVLGFTFCSMKHFD
jgi:hypothetical protein